MILSRPFRRAWHWPPPGIDRKSTRLNSSHTVIYTLSLHDALPIYGVREELAGRSWKSANASDDFVTALPTGVALAATWNRSEEHTSELQSHSDLHSFPTRRSSDLWRAGRTSRAFMEIRQRFG